MIKDNTGILFASLVGSRVASSIPRFQSVQNELMKHVLPPIPFLPFKNESQIIKDSGTYNAALWQADKPLPVESQFFPLFFVGPNGEKFLFPYEPMINISGKNTIVRRNVAKAKTKTGSIVGGSIKERWNQADYDITITGALFGETLVGNDNQCFPRADFEKLRDFMIDARRIQVFCEPLYLLGINYIVIEDFSFPFTKGENVQAYEIKAYSDFDYKLLLSLED